MGLRSGLQAIGFLLFISVTSVTIAQETEIYTNELKHYRRGLELYDKEKFSAAFNAFELALEDMQEPSGMAYEEATYHKALCALHLFNRDAEYLLKEFIKHYPESPRVKNAYFQLGRYNYRQKQWEEVVLYLSEIDPYDLTPEERAEYYFKKGYAQFREENYTEAKRDLYQLIDVPGTYHAPANYYYGHIAYEDGNYETALKSFTKLKTDEKFKPVVPYYITQIYYHQERYDSLISYGTPLLEQDKIKRKPEIARLVGESYFNKKQYSEAIPHLEYYAKESSAKTREDDYQLGYAYYKAGEPVKAIATLKKTTYTADSLAQSANYLIAESYMDAGDKRSALSAYQNTYSLDFDKKLSEESLFNYAKLSYELEFDPYNKAIDAFIKYLETYPNALRSEQAYEYLINIYLNTKNYSAAIASLETTMSMDKRFKKVYQQLVYNLAVEQFASGQYYNSIETFDQSLTRPEDKTLAALANYWKADAYYRERIFHKAIQAYQDFMYEPRAILLPEFYLAHYGTAYSYFQKKDYAQAASWFRKFLAYKEADSLRTNDALIRTGDCYFIQKEYLVALEYYRQAIDLGVRDTDYALYQFALASGVVKRDDDKLAALQRMEKEYPESDFIDAALYELGRTYVAQNKTNDALSYMNRVVENHPNSSYKRKAMVSTGLIYYNMDRNDEALTIFKKVVEENPNYSDSKEALRGIQNIFKESGDVSGYESYISTLAFMNISDGSLDSLNYESTELRYMAGNCSEAISGFQRYLSKFDQPIFYLNASFYLAQCLYKSGNFPEALNYYTNVLRRPTSKFTEPALVKASYINFITNQFEVAASQYERLYELANYPENKERAIIGLMQSYYEYGAILKADSVAYMVENINSLDERLVAQSGFIHALALLEQEKSDTARALFMQLADSSQSEFAAHGLYLTAQSLYEEGLQDSAETVIFKLVNFTPTYDTFLAKGLILLSDVYLAKDDPFQAKATLESIIENYTGDDALKKEAEEKLNNLLEENSPPEPEPEPDMEIDMGIDELDYDALFEEELPIEEPNQNNE